MQRFIIFFLFPFMIFACPDGSIQGADANTCYKFVNSPSNWYTAERTCVTYGGHLVSIGSTIENTFLVNQAKSQFGGGAQDFWIGSNNILLTSNWTWTDVTPFTYTNWAKGEPNKNTTDGFYCLKQNIATGQWAPEICVYNKSFVCKVPKNGPPCDANWTYYTATNTCYKLVTSSNFTNAHNQCLSFGGDLASIHNSLQGSVISSFAFSQRYSTFWVWIGMYFPIDHTWGWVDGSRVDYLNWMPGEPNNLRGYQCTVMQTANNWTHPWKAQLCNDWAYYFDAACVKSPNF